MIVVAFWFGLGIGYLVTCLFLEGQCKRCRELEAQAFKQKSDLDAAWGIIANVGNGDWSKESEVWQEAANEWGNGYFQRPYETLKKK